MRDHEGQHAPVARVQPAEKQTHREVAGECPKALVEVVAAAQDRTGEDDLPFTPAHLAQACKQVSDDDNLFGQAGSHRGKHQHRHGPPVRAQRGRNDVHGDPQLAAGEVEQYAWHADEYREAHAARRVAPGLAAVDPQPSKVRLCDLPEQEGDQRDGHQVEEDPEQLVDQVEHRAGAERTVQRRGLLG